jgi:RHS repeat-associated protein
LAEGRGGKEQVPLQWGNDYSKYYETSYRSYDASLGRFMQADPLAEMTFSPSPYIFALNNPVRWNDPLGLLTQKEFDDIMSELWSYEFGGSWSSGGSGTITKFTSYEEGFFGNHGGMAYNDYHNSWGHTEHGNAASSIVAFGIQMVNGEMPSKADVQSVINPGMNNALASTSTDIPGKSLLQIAWESYCTMLYNTAFFGSYTNPFYQAEAFFVDGGSGIVGDENDWGYFFILFGKETGRAVSYAEAAEWGGTDIGLGAEIGKIEVWGDLANFDRSYLFGLRTKAYLSFSPLGELISAGGAVAWSYLDQSNTWVIAYSIQLSFGVSLTPFISIGGNKGKIKPINRK